MAHDHTKVDEIEAHDVRRENSKKIALLAPLIDGCTSSFLLPVHAER
jgi:hypothetical protein